MCFLGLAITASSQVGSAESDLLMGTWQLNLTKSRYSPGPPPKSQTVSLEAGGKGILATTNAQGNQNRNEFTFVEDGKPYPVTGNPVFDASAWTRADPYTVIISRTKAGKVSSDPVCRGVSRRQDDDHHSDRGQC